MRRFSAAVALAATLLMAPAAKAAQPNGYLESIKATSATASVARAEVYDGGEEATYRVRYAPASATWCTTGADLGAPTMASAPQTLTGDGTSHRVQIPLTGLTAGAGYCAVVEVANASGTGSDWQPTDFVQGRPWAEAFARVTGRTTARVTGTVNPGGQATTYRVEYDLASSAWCDEGTGSPAHATASAAIGSGTEDRSVAVPLSGLTAGQRYCVALAATNASGTTRERASLTAGAPRADMDEVDHTTATSAVAFGSVDPMGQPTTYRAVYAPSESDWCQSEATSGSPAAGTASAPLPGTSARAVSVTIGGLTAGEDYCAALVAANASGTTTGTPWFFTGTASGGLDSADSTGPTSVRFEGSVDGQGQATTYRVAYDLATSSWCQSDGDSGTPAHTTGAKSVPASAESVPVTVEASGLAAGTDYCAKLVTQNASGSGRGWMLSFTQGAPGAILEDVIVEGASAIHVMGRIAPAGQSSTFRVAYGPQSSEWCQDDGQSGSPAHITPTAAVPSGDEVEVSADLSGLTPGAPMCAALVAANASGTETTYTFWFVVGAASASIERVRATGPTAARLTGAVYGGKQTTSYRVAYDLATSPWCEDGGRSGSAAHVTAVSQLASATEREDVAVTLTGLTAGSRYCAAIVAVNGSATTTTDPERFVAGEPYAATQSSDVRPTSATLHGDVSTAGQATQYWFEWDEADSFYCRRGDGIAAHATTARSMAAGSGSVAVTEPIGGLVTGTEYCYRLVASNASGESRGETWQFVAGEDDGQPQDPDEPGPQDPGPQQPVRPGPQGPAAPVAATTPGAAPAVPVPGATATVSKPKAPKLAGTAVATGGKVRCPAGGACTVNARLLAGKKVIGTLRAKVAGGKSLAIKVKLNAKGKALVRKGRRLKLTSVVTVDQPGSTRVTSRSKLTLEPRKKRR